MNTQSNTYETNKISTRTVVNFPFLSTASLGELIDTLGFKMGLPELHYCQNVFRHNNFNNPTINELKIIDRVFFDHVKRPSSLLVASFMTNDQTVAETYADLMSRRRIVAPDYTAPCSIAEMLNILPKYLGKTDNCNVVLSSGKYRDAELSVRGCKKIAETGESDLNCSAGIKLKGQAHSSIANGNVVYAILNSFNRHDDFQQRLNKLLSSVNVLKDSKKTVFFNDESIITAIASMGYGMKLNTIYFDGKDDCISPFEPFAEGDTGALVVFDKSASVDMLLVAQLLELTVVPLGYITSSKTINGISKSGEHLSLNVDFLRTLCFSRPISIRSDCKSPQISERESSVYVNVNAEKYKMNSAVCNGESYYAAGINSVLYAYSLCVASGTLPSTVTGTYTLPLTDVECDANKGAAVELLLGAYRAECEFELSDANPTIEFGSSASLCFHTFATVSKGISSKFIGKDSKIYYLEPTYEKNGLPDFENLRQMHTYIRSLIARGAILSILPTTDDIKKALRKMSENVKPVLEESFLPASHYGGFIIESAEHVQGAVIGKIE